MQKSKTFEEQWPLWPPSYDAPLQLVDIRVKLPVDSLFDLLYASGSDFVARSQERRGNKDYVESPWLASTEELSAIPHLSPPVPKQQQPAMELADYRGRIRKTSCSSFGMGMKFKTEEVQRCLAAEEGKCFVVEVCVATTATYGDKFRGVCRHRLSANGPQWSTWKAEFALVYVAPVNGLLKKAIEKGSAGGLAKNFATLVEILGEYAEVAKPQEEHAVTPSVPGEIAGTRSQPRVLGVLDEGFVRLFEPVAALVCRTGSQQGAATQDVSRTATAIAVLVLLITLQCLLALVRLALYCFGVNPGWLGIPGSVSGVVFSIAVFVMAQRGAPVIAAAVSSLFSRLPGKLRRNSTSLPNDLDADVPRKGTRFEGFDAALESANAEITSGEQELRAASLANLALQRTAPTREQLRTGVRGFQKLVSDTWTAGRRRMANGSLTPERAISPARDQGSDSRLGRSRGSSPLPTSPKSEAEDVGVLSDDALRQRRFNDRKPRARRRSDKVLMHSFNTVPRGSGDDSEAQRSVEMSAMGPRPPSFTSQESSLTESEGPGPVEAEVFENERFLPFRGWGHQWPGHLLPTDRVGHWSIQGDRPSGAESMDFHNVAPGLPEGWEWLEEDWHIDLTGLEEGCVDEEGWYYAVDFNWLRHPPPPGAGRFKRVRDYVRRRRWVRTRVRCDAMMATGDALRRLASLSQPPPLLPLTQLLGDLAITPDTQPKLRSRLASSEPGTLAENSAPFELRPADKRAVSAEMQTPRLVMRPVAEENRSAEVEEARPVLLRLSIAPQGDSTRECGSVTVNLTLRQQQAADMRLPPSSERGVQLPELATGKEQTEGAAQSERVDRIAGPSAHATVGGDGASASASSDQPVASTAKDEAAGKAAADELEATDTAHAATAASSCRAAVQLTDQVADPFAAAAGRTDAEELDACDASPQPRLAESAHGVEDDAPDAVGLLADPEQVEMQIAASMQPSSEGSGAHGTLGPGSLQHGDEPRESAHERDLTEQNSRPDQGDDFEVGQAAPKPEQDSVEGKQGRVEAGPATVTQEPHAVLVSTLRDQEHEKASAGLGSAAEDTASEEELPSVSVAYILEQRGVTADASAERLGEMSVNGEEVPAAPPSSSASLHEPGSKEQTDWEHVRSASDGEFDDIGVVVHHEHASPADDDPLATVEGAGAQQKAGSGLVPLQQNESTVSAVEAQTLKAAHAPLPAPDAPAEAGSPAQESESPTEQTSSAAALLAVRRSAPAARQDQGRQVTPERQQREALLPLPRGPGDSPPILSPGAVDWSQIGKKSGQLAALAGDSLRKGFAHAASHASNAARQTTKREPRAPSPPADKTPQAQQARAVSTPPKGEQQGGGPRFLQSLKSRGEQSLHAARSVLSPEAMGHSRADGAASSDGAAAVGEGGRGEHAALGSMRGMFSDLKRTMERVGHATPLMNMASFGKHDAALPPPRSSSDVQQKLSDAHPASIATSKSQDPGQVAAELAQAMDMPSTAEREEAASAEEVKAGSRPVHQRGVVRGEAMEGPASKQTADEWGDFDFNGE